MNKLNVLREEQQHRLLPLTPYSQNYNPIEKTWAHLRKALQLGNTFLRRFVLFLFQIITPCYWVLTDDTPILPQKTLPELDKVFYCLGITVRFKTTF